jgi:hypothetical protein
LSIPFLPAGRRQSIMLWTALAMMVLLALPRFGYCDTDIEPRLALVIGNSAYDGPLSRLVNPANDARLIALKQIGFRRRCGH